MIMPHSTRHCKREPGGEAHSRERGRYGKLLRALAGEYMFPIVMNKDGLSGLKPRDGKGPETPGRSPLPVQQRESGAGASHLLVNITVNRRFDHRFLYRLVSLALRIGGMLDKCNGESARFAFPSGSVGEFMQEIDCRAPVLRTSVSPRDSGGSWVNVRFQA